MWTSFQCDQVGKFELGFEVALSITGNVLVYSECDNVIEKDKDRKVTRNYGH